MSQREMNNNDIVSLNDAKKLKQDGYNIPTEYYYLDKDLPYCPKGIYRTKDKHGGKLNHNSFDEFIYSAPFIKDLKF